jgi:hypothetical protein
MKKLFYAVTALCFLSNHLLFAQATKMDSQTDRAAKTNFQVSARGANYRVLQRTTAQTNRLGHVHYQTNSYTELETGMHYRDDTGKWVESEATIEVNANGATATKGPHKAKFLANINSSGAVETTTADGKTLRSRIFGLSYFDHSSGQAVLIAGLKDSYAELVSPNQLYYPDSFDDVKADVQYVYLKSGIEQNIILRECPPSPSEYGLNSRTTHLQVLTEFINPPTPQKTISRVGATFVDEILDFGLMKMTRGRAFVAGSNPRQTDSIPVAKQWSVIEGRTFLVEEVPFKSVDQHLKRLGKAPRQASISRDRTGKGDNVLAALRTFFPKRLAGLERREPQKASIRMARLAVSNEPGFVLDYQLVASDSNFTFESGKTYLITNHVNLDGNTTIKGGAVIKFADPTNTFSVLSLQGALACKTGPYNMAVVTSANDNSIGEWISSSTGIPTNSPTFMIEGLGPADTNTAWELSHMKMSYGVAGFAAYDGRDVIVRDCQFVNTTYGVGNVSMIDDDWVGNVTVENSLFTGCQVPFYVCDKLVAINVTVDGFTSLCLSYDGLNGLAFTNSLICGNGAWVVAEDGSTNLPMPVLSHTIAYSTNSGLFTTIGAGNYYLTANSTNRNAGTTNIYSSLRATLKASTTYPPILQTNSITTNTTFSPQALFDTDTPDLGYHYDPIDYLVSCMVTNTTLTLTNGVAVAYYNHIGIWLRDDARLFSKGTPLNPNKIFFYTFVQEQPVNLGQYDRAVALPVSSWHVDLSRHPEATFRFTTFKAPQGANYVVYAGSGNWDYRQWHFRDCEFVGNGAAIYNFGAVTNGSYQFFNNLFERCRFLLMTEADASANLEVRNNLFRASPEIDIENWASGIWQITDNVFDEALVYLDGSQSYNSYLNSCTILSTPQTNDLIITNFSWVVGPLGSYYQPTNSALINAGSLTNAGLAGFYHYSTTTNQAKEASSPLDIGYHYVSLGENGEPIDSDGDGLADYNEDSNGNGSYESPPDLASWLLSDTDGDGLPDRFEVTNGFNPNVAAIADTNNVTRLKVYTPLK